MTLLRLTLHHARRYWVVITLAIALQLLQTLAALWLPSLNATIIDEGVTRGDTGFIWHTGGIMLLAAVGQVICAVAAVACGAYVAMRIGGDLRARVYHKATQLSIQQSNAFGAGTLITRGTNDVQQVQMLVLMTLNFMVSAPIMAIGGIIMALREDVALSWIVWASVAVLAVVVGVLVWLLLPMFRETQDRVDAINGVLREQIMGIRVVRAFVRERYEEERYAKANDAITRISVRIGNVFVLLFPIIMLVLHAATAAVVWFGGHRADAGQMQIGSLTAFLQYLLQILIAIMMGVFMTMLIPRAVVCAERIQELLDTPHEGASTAGNETDAHPALADSRTDARPSPAAPLHPTPTHGRIEFRNVTFGFPGAELPVVRNLSFTIEPGSTTAIIGSTGAGKSVLLNLLTRLYEPQQGEIVVDGIPVAELTRAQLAATFAAVPQRSYLFSGTIASNLRFGREDATEEELWQALNVAQAADFVREKEHGLDEPIAQGGTNVSGGQRQRLAIARALVAQPLVLLFDDSFSALDVATDARLRAALQTATAGTTTVIVGQRISSIRHAQQILVLDRGEIVGRGTHDELVQSNSVYQEIVESQLATEEAA